MGGTQKTVEIVRSMAAVMDENRQYLTKLDSEIGDGDHGNNMRRGFQAALERLEGTEPASPADVLKAVSVALVGKVGGAAGPLYGTAFLRASSELSGKEEVSPEDIAGALEAALKGLQQRGKAEVGDKTMVDALTPAVEAAKEAAGSADASATSVFRAAADAAEEGAEATVPLTARRGRASYLGVRAEGHRDPGATSTHLLLDAAARTLEGVRMTVGLVLVSHSPKIAEGTADLVRQMAGEVEISAVGGDSEGGFGTDPERIETAISETKAEEVLIFMDLGSAVLSAETVLEMLPEEDRSRVRLVDAPFVEGAFSAGVSASAGSDADECVADAMEARTEPKLHE